LISSVSPINREQASCYGLPSAPPKETDRRAFDDVETWQAEALDPAVLAEITKAAIDQRLDRAAFDRVPDQEQRDRENLVSRLGGEIS